MFTISPWLAYECMITAYNDKRWWAAYQLSANLLKWLKDPANERRFGLKKIAKIAEIERQTKRRLEATPDPIEDPLP